MILYDFCQNWSALSAKISNLPINIYYSWFDSREWISRSIRCEMWWEVHFKQHIWNKGNAKRGVSPLLTILPCDLDIWPMTLKINRIPDSPKDYVCTKIGQNPLKDVDSSVQKDVMRYKFDPWPWKSIGFQTLRRTKYVPSLVKIHWRMLILVFKRMLCVKNWPGDLDNQ